MLNLLWGDHRLCHIKEMEKKNSLKLMQGPINARKNRFLSLYFACVLFSSRLLISFPVLKLEPVALIWSTLLVTSLDSQVSEVEWALLD
jgi:uncharacterized membrane protein